MRARRASTALAAAALASLTVPAVAHPAPPTASPKVRVATTGSHSELRRTLPVTAGSRRGRRVVMSMGPGQLPSLKVGDRLELSAELQLTANCIVRSPRCVGPSYRYSPVVRSRLVLAPSRRTTRASRILPLTPPKREVCGNRVPNREHHCVIVFRRVVHRFEPGEALPCRLDACHVNLMVDARNRRAGPRDRIMVGGQWPNGHIPQDRGRINAVRTSPDAAVDAPLLATDRRRRSAVRPDGSGRVIYSIRLDRLEAGEQLAVEGAVHTRIGHLHYNTLTAAQLVLADRPHQIKPGARARRVASTGAEIDERNGFNCTQNRARCSSRKVGVARIEHDSVDARGRPRPLYVNLVLISGPKRAAARRRDRVRVVRGGGVGVVRYPAELAG